MTEAQYINSDINREKAEDQSDLLAYEKAKAEYLEDPTTYSHEEVIKMFEDDEEDDNE